MSSKSLPLPTKQRSPQRRKLQTRAVKDQDKMHKKAELLRIASRLLSHCEIDRFSMADFAKKARVAKGTLYLYFQTKEELALRVHMEDFSDWFHELDAFLLASGPLRSAELVHWLVDSVRRRQRFLQMVPLVPTVLERHVSKELIREYKHFLNQAISRSAALLAEKQGHGDPARSTRLLLQFHALIVGFWSQGFPAPLVQEVLDQDQLLIFKTDYFAAIHDSLLCLARADEPTNPLA